MTTFEGPPVEGFAGLGALTLGGLLDEVADRFAANEAVVFDDPLRDGKTVRWPYGRLRAEARTVARALIAAGVERGDGVGIVMGNRPEALASIFGAAMAGAIAVPISTFARPHELAVMLERAQASVVLTQARLRSRRYGDDVRALQPDLPALRLVAVVGEDSWGRFLAGADAVGDDALDRRLAGTGPDDPALVIFSSGTTSAPKGMLHAHRAPAQQMWVQARIFGRHEHTRMWTALPLFWTAGFNTAVGATLAAGGCWVAQEAFDPAEALALMSRERTCVKMWAVSHSISLRVGSRERIGLHASRRFSGSGFHMRMIGSPSDRVMNTSLSSSPTVSPSSSIPFGSSDLCGNFALARPITRTTTIACSGTLPLKPLLSAPLKFGRSPASTLIASFTSSGLEPSTSVSSSKNAPAAVRPSCL